jgi:hypothetical protein
MDMVDGKGNMVGAAVYGWGDVEVADEPEG